MSSARTPLVSPSLPLAFFAAVLSGILGGYLLCTNVQMSTVPAAPVDEPLVESTADVDWTRGRASSQWCNPGGWIVYPSVPARASVQYDFEEESLESKYGGPFISERPGPSLASAIEHPTFRHRSAGAPRLLGRADAAMVRATVRYNTGAYRRCYREALARRPGLSGRVTIEVTFDPNGCARPWALVKDSTVADRELEQCLASAFGALWLDPPAAGTVTTVRYPFRLAPAAAALIDEPPARDTPSEIELRAVRALRHEQGDLALRMYRALAEQLRDHEHACAWRVGALRAAMQVAPWLDDPRVERTAHELAAELADNENAKCASLASPLLLELGTTPHRQAQKLRSAALYECAEAAYRRLLAVPGAPDAPMARYYLAELLFTEQRYDEALEYYQMVAGDPDHRYRREAEQAASLCGAQVELAERHR